MCINSGPFSSKLTELYDLGVAREQTFFSEKNVFLGNINAQFLVPFLSKCTRIYDFGVCKGAASHCLSENFVFYKLNTHNFRPFFGLNLQKYVISGGHKGQPFFS